MERVLHRAAGLVLSAPCALPGFVPLHDAFPADLSFHPNTCPPWATVDQVHHAAQRAEPGSAITVSRSADGVFVAYQDGTAFWISADAREIWSLWPRAATLADTCTYLASSVLGYALRMRGALALHASAVEIAGRAVALVGPHGAGKSTTALALARRGHPIVCDDLLRLRLEGDAWLADPYPGIVRLWPDAAPLVFGRDMDLPPITQGWDKRFVSPAADGVPNVTTPVPLGGLLLLQPRTEAPPSIEHLAPATALIALVSHSAAALLLDAATRAREFEMLSALAGAIRCGRATASADPEQLADFVAAIERWSTE